MTLGQFFLGLVTLLVATIVYRWQKSVDRKTAALLELRASLSKYAALSHALFLKQPYIGDEEDTEKQTEFFSISDAEIELYTLRDQIYFTAPKNIVDAVLECDRAFRDWKIAFPKLNETQSQENEDFMKKIMNFKSKRERMLLTFREEFESHTKFAGQDWLQGSVSRLFRQKRD